LFTQDQRPRAIGALGSNADAPAPPVPSRRRVFPHHFAVRVDELEQNLDDRHVRCSSCASPPRHAHTIEIIEDTLLTMDIVRTPLKSCVDTPTLTLTDHLVFIISTLDKGALRVPERRCFVLCRQAHALLFETVKNRRLVDSDLLRTVTGTVISYLPTVSMDRFHLREVFNAQEQYNPRSFLSQVAVDNLLFWSNFGFKSPENLQELCPDQPSTTFYTDAIGHHRLGLCVGSAPRDNEIECRIADPIC
jgi:hypothetical protein